MTVKPHAFTLCGAAVWRAARRAACLVLVLACAWGMQAQAAAAPPGLCDQPVLVLQTLRSVSLTPGDVPSEGVVTLPDRLMQAFRHEDVRVSYALDVSACADAPAAALWFFRIGAPYRVYANAASQRGGVPLVLLNANQRAQTVATQRVGDAPVVYNGRIPALYALPPGTRRVVVELQTLPYMPYGLVQVEIGATNPMLQRHSDMLHEVLGYSDASAGVVTVLGAMLLMLWLSRRRDINLLWLALACGLWGLRGLLYFDNTVPGLPLVFEQFNTLSALWVVVMVTLASLHMLHGERRRQRAVVGGGALLVTAVFVAVAVAGQGALQARSLVQIGGMGMTVWLGIEIIRQFFTEAERRWQLLAMLACLATLLACAGHDLLIVAGVLPATSAPYVFWGFVVVLVGFVLISGQYVVVALSRAERSNDELELRVAAKSSELARSYQQLHSSEITAARNAARTQEREHLLREMHDGLGAQLMTALRGVERGALSRDELAASLQDGLDEIRLLMDSTDTRQYLPGVLAAWRNRWDARLAAAGVTLEWAIDESLDGVQLGSDAALQIMRILQEAATNVVKHSQAAHMRFKATVRGAQECGLEPAELCIDIVDNGVGPGTGPVRQGARGLKNMHYRAIQIGAVLQVLSREAPATGCCVRLRLPLPPA